MLKLIFLHILSQQSYFSSDCLLIRLIIQSIKEKFSWNLRNGIAFYWWSRWRNLCLLSLYCEAALRLCSGSNCYGKSHCSGKFQYGITGDIIMCGRSAWQGFTLTECFLVLLVFFHHIKIWLRTLNATVCMYDLAPTCLLNIITESFCAFCLFRSFIVEMKSLKVALLP